jgi:hypothetical protein
MMRKSNRVRWTVGRCAIAHRHLTTGSPHGSDSRVDRVVVVVGDRRIVHSAPAAAADPQCGLAASRIAKPTTGKTASSFEASCQRITHAEASPAGCLWPPEIAMRASVVARQCGIRRLRQRPRHRRSQYLEAWPPVNVRRCMTAWSSAGAVVLARHFRGPMSSRISRSPGAWVAGRRRSSRTSTTPPVRTHAP